MNDHTFRKTQKDDIQKIMKMIQEARVYLKQNGIAQWNNGYPNPQTIQQDIKNGNSYVLEIVGNVVGSAALIYGQDKTYNHIEQGKWLTEGNNYLTVHRMVVDSREKRKGLGSLIMVEVEKICKKRNIPSIRVDTQKDNKVMEKFLIKIGFKHCGRIYAERGENALAFQKIIA